VAYEDALPVELMTADLVDIAGLLLRELGLDPERVKEIILDLCKQLGIPFTKELRDLIYRERTVWDFARSRPEHPAARKWLTPPAVRVRPGGWISSHRLLERLGLPPGLRDRIVAAIPDMPVSHINLPAFARLLRDLDIPLEWRVRLAVELAKVFGIEDPTELLMIMLRVTP